MSVFLKTVDVTTEPAPFVKRGQWVMTTKGKGQVIAIRKGKLIVSLLRKGEKFNERTQRFARAVWFSKPHSDVGTAVANAPLSLKIEQLKKRLGM